MKQQIFSPNLPNCGRLSRCLIALTALLFLVSCAQMPSTQQQALASNPPEKAAKPPPKPKKTNKKAEKHRLWAWSGDGRKVTHIVVNTKTQKAHFYDGEDEIGWTYVASGRRSHPTPTGKFSVLEKVADKRSNLYGRIYNAKGRLVKSNAKYGRDPIPKGGRFVGAKMPFFMRLTNDGIGLHAGRIPRPGSPASHGCIRMPKDMAPVLYRHVSVGTPVTVMGPGPSYGEYAKRLRQKARAARIAKAKKAEAKRAAQEKAAKLAQQPPEPSENAIAQAPEVQESQPNALQATGVQSVEPATPNAIVQAPEVREVQPSIPRAIEVQSVEPAATHTYPVALSESREIPAAQPAMEPPVSPPYGGAPAAQIEREALNPPVQKPLPVPAEEAVYPERSTVSIPVSRLE